MVIHNLHIAWSGRLVRPFEADPPPIVDANAVLALAITHQYLEPVTRQRSDVLQRARRFKAVELQARGPLDSEERLDPLSRGEVSRALVPVSYDQSVRIIQVTRYVKRNVTASDGDGGLDCGGFKRIINRLDPSLICRQCHARFPHIAEERQTLCRTIRARVHPDGAGRRIRSGPHCLAEIYHRCVAGREFARSAWAA